MKDYRHGAHTVYEIHLHLVWITKYRRKVLTSEVGIRVRDMIREICSQQEVTIFKGHVSKDHVHLFVSIPPQVTISRFLQRLKGKTAYKLLHEFPHLRKKFWGGHIWARGYFCCSSGNVTDDAIVEYIETQSHEDGVDFKVEGEEPSEREPPST